MAGTIEAKIASLGITLPTPASPIANYVPFVRSGNLLIVSGQLCFGADGKLVAKGQLGGDVSIEDGQKAGRACAVVPRLATRKEFPITGMAWASVQ